MQRAYWDNRARQYGGQYGLDKEFNKMKVRRKIEVANQHVSLSSPVKLLEVGCGTGIYTDELRKMNNEMIAVDISPKMMAVAIKKCPDIKFVQMDARKLSFGTCNFDVVFSAFLLQHVHAKVVVAEMHRVLKVGGYMVAFVPNILNPIHYGRARNCLFRAMVRETSQSEDFTKWQWVRILRDSGYGEITVKPVSFDSPHTPMFLSRVVFYMSDILEKIPLIREFAGSLMIIARRI
jgi:ubiquinone/menaquinone biosynthesis C-methylase UbiE